MILRNNQPQARRRRRAGFTLAELLAVVAILAILAGVSIYGYKEIIGNMRVKTAITESKGLSKALKDFAMAHLEEFPPQGFPDPSTGFEVLVQYSMLERAPVDPWKNFYQWQLQQNPVSGILEPIVFSPGPDGVMGTGDDISSMQQ
jgi:general secretion pathway protein G